MDAEYFEKNIKETFGGLKKNFRNVMNEVREDQLESFKKINEAKAKKNKKVYDKLDKELEKIKKQMNKADLVNEVVKVVSTKKEAQAALDCVISSITKAMKKGEDVTLTGFGTFKVVERKARKGRNIYTGEEIKIQASKAPKFTSGKALKEIEK